MSRMKQMAKTILPVAVENNVESRDDDNQIPFVRNLVSKPIIKLPWIQHGDVVSSKAIEITSCPKLHTVRSRTKSKNNSPTNVVQNEELDILHYGITKISLGKPSNTEDIFLASNKDLNRSQALPVEHQPSTTKENSTFKRKNAGQTEAKSPSKGDCESTRSESIESFNFQASVFQTKPNFNSLYKEQQITQEETVFPMSVVNEFVKNSTKSSTKSRNQRESPKNPVLVSKFNAKPEASYQRNESNQGKSFLITGHESIVRSSEQHPTPWQLEIPHLSDIQAYIGLSYFMDKYRILQSPINLTQLVGLSKEDLYLSARGDNVNRILKDYNCPAIEFLLDCGKDIHCVLGYERFSSNEANAGATDPDDEREFLIVERERQLVCVIKGNKQEQKGKIRYQNQISQSQQTASLPYLPNDSKHNKVTVFKEPYSRFKTMEERMFMVLDSLTEKHPFYDVVFTGYSFGATIATLASFVYANARPSIRVSNLVFNSCLKVGLNDLRMAAHSTPNLKIIRLEIEQVQSKPLNKGSDIGHFIQVSLSSAPTIQNMRKRQSTTKQETVLNRSCSLVVEAYKFGYNQIPKQRLTTILPKRSSKDISDYKSAMDAIETVNWVNRYKQDVTTFPGNETEPRNVT